MKTQGFVVHTVEQDRPVVEAAESDADRLSELAAVDASLWGLLATLLSFKTMPHLLGLVIISTFLYALADGDAGLAAVGFTSIALGYCATAILSNIVGIRSWTQLQPWGEERPPLFKRLLLSTRILALPFSLALILAISFFVLTSEGAATWLALGLAGLFVLWAIAQGRSFAGWASSIAARKSPASTPKSGQGFIGLLTLAIIVLVFGAVCITAYASFHAPSLIVQPQTIDIAVFTAVSLAAFGLMNGLTWSNRKIAMADKALRRFHFRWSLLIHLFVTWHLLTVYRHAAMNPGAIEVYIEEIALMVFTVFMGIWSLTSRGFGSDLKLLNTNNALPWGLAFGYAYAGSVAMISSVVDDFQTVMMLGHIIAATTGIAMHRSVLAKLLVRHNEEQEIQKIVEHVEPLHTKDEAANPKLQATSRVSEAGNQIEEEDWDGALDNDWETPKDIGIKAEVEWDDVINIED